MNPHLKGCILIIISMIAWATIGIFVRYIGLPSNVIVFFTSFFGFLFLTIYLMFKRKLKEILKTKQKPLLLISGILVALNIFFYYKAYSLTTLANSVLTHYTAPIFAALFAPLYLKERLEKITIYSLTISFLGLLIITLNGLSFKSLDIGVLFGTLSGLFYGFLILVNKKLVKNVKSKIIIIYQAFISFLIMTPFLFITPFLLNIKSITLLILYSLILFIGASLIYLAGLKYVEAQHAGIIAYAEPVFVFIFGFLFFKEIPTIRTFIGGLLILFSGYLILRAEIKRNEQNI